jgi:hypothetical protein
MQKTRIATDYSHLFPIKETNFYVGTQVQGQMDKYIDHVRVLVEFSALSASDVFLIGWSRSRRSKRLVFDYDRFASDTEVMYVRQMAETQQSSCRFKREFFEFVAPRSP